MKEKMIARHYLKTGILGAYETAEVDYDESIGGKYAPCFDDAVSHFEKNYSSIYRTMIVDDRCFKVCSVFSNEAVHTPTDKLLGLIDADLEKPDFR